MTDRALEALAARVEALRGPDPTVDELILLATGWTLERAEGLGERATWINPQGERTTRRQGDGWFNPTASIDAAMALVPEGCVWTVGDWRANGGPPAASVWPPEDERPEDYRGIAHAATPALALTAACLRAIAGKEG